MKSLVRLPLLYLSLLFFTSCFEFEDIAVSPYEGRFTFPLLNTELSMTDLLREDSSNRRVIEDENQALTYVYLFSDSTGSFSDLFVLNDLTSSFIYENQSPVDQPTTSGQIIPLPNVTSSIPFELPNNAQVTTVRFSGGKLTIRGASSFQHSLDMIVGISGLRNPSGISTFGDLNFQGENLIGNTKARDAFEINDLSGYTLEIVNNGATSEILISIDASISASGKPIRANDEVELAFEFENLEWEYLEGSLGDLDLAQDLEDSLKIEFFETRFDGSIFLERPSLTLSFDNYSGIPVNFSVESITAYANRAEPVELTENGSSDLEPIFIDGVRLNDYNNGVRFKNTSKTYDNSNSNIVEVFSIAPNSFLVEGTALSVENSTETTFAFDDSQIILNGDATIPLVGRIEEYVLRDTIKLDFPVEQGIQRVLFYSEATNNIPLGADVQIYFVDSRQNFAIIDSLYADENTVTLSGGGFPGANYASLVSPATIDTTNGEVIESTFLERETIWDAERYVRIRDTANALIVNTKLFSTDNGQTVTKLFNKNSLRVRLGVILEIKEDL